MRLLLLSLVALILIEVHVFKVSIFKFYPTFSVHFKSQSSFVKKYCSSIFFPLTEEPKTVSTTAFTSYCMLALAVLFRAFLFLLPANESSGRSNILSDFRTHRTIVALFSLLFKPARSSSCSKRDSSFGSHTSDTLRFIQKLH